MILNCLLNLLRFDADVSLRGGCGTVLKEPLHQCYVKAVCVVDFRCIPLAEAVGTDTLVPQIIADDMKLLLYRPLCDRKHKVVPADAVPQTVVFHVLLNDHRDCKDTPFPCLLLHHFQTEAISVPYNVARSELYDVADPQAQVALQHQCRSNSVIGTAAAEALSYGLYNLFVLLCCQCLCFLVHGSLQ